MTPALVQNKAWNHTSEPKQIHCKPCFNLEKAKDSTTLVLKMLSFSCRRSEPGSKSRAGRDTFTAGSFHPWNSTGFYLGVSSLQQRKNSRTVMCQQVILYSLRFFWLRFKGNGDWNWTLLLPIKPVFTILFPFILLLQNRALESYTDQFGFFLILYVPVAVPHGTLWNRVYHTLNKCASTFTTELQVTQFTLGICNTVDFNDRNILTDVTEAKGNNITYQFSS